MTLNELLRALGITEKDANLERIVDGVVPRVDFVDLGANGYGDNGWLVKKGRRPMFGSLQQDEKGNWSFVEKSAADDNKAKISASNKQAVTDLISASKAQIAALEKAMENTEDDDSATDMPDGIKEILANMSKAVQPADESKPAPEPASAEPAAKAGTEPEPEPEPVADDGTFALGDMVLTGGLAKLAKSLAEKAGDSMEDEEFSGKLAEALAGMANIEAMVDPGSAAVQAVATVKGRFDSKFAELKAENAKLQATVNAMVAGGIAGGLVIPDGSPQPAPTSKGRGSKVLPTGADVNELMDEDSKFSFNFPQQ